MIMLETALLGTQNSCCFTKAKLPFHASHPQLVQETLTELSLELRLNKQFHRRYEHEAMHNLYHCITIYYANICKLHCIV